MTREQRFADDLRRQYPDVRFRDASPLLLAMREIKSPAELTLIQRAIDITAEAQKAAMARVLTATRESEVQATIEFTFRNLGACCWGFPSIVAAGRNATTLHYETNNDPIVRDGLLLTDIGAEVEGYSADVTRTYPADGTFSPEQRAIYEVVLAAQNESLALMRPGHRHLEVNNKAIEVVGRELLKLGLVTKSTPEQAGLYLFHGTGHPLGLQTHDVYDRARAYEPGMVFTNEPGVYVRKDDILASEIFGKLPPAEQTTMRAALQRYDGIGIRIEDDVLITAGEPKVLSAGRAEARWRTSKRGWRVPDRVEPSPHLPTNWSNGHRFNRAISSSLRRASLSFGSRASAWRKRAAASSRRPSSCSAMPRLVRTNALPFCRARWAS